LECLQGLLKEYDMKYTVVLQRENDGGYVATVPALPGCVSQGDTREEALKNIEEAMELYLEDVKAADEPIPTEDGREYVEVTAAV
jgi:predicted RNase H-like HicB family nuclease